MERVIGWVDADGGQRWQGGADALRERAGMTLRPTGMVVFATLERAHPDGMLPSLAPAPAWTRREPLPPDGRAERSPQGGSPRPAQPWRHLAARGAAWLLGR